MNQKTPIYRAKSNERKNSYVEGFLIGLDEDLNLCTIRTKDDYIGGEICYLHTLSIHFPDMIDSQGNKIFASLSEDGKGGDIVEGKCRDVNGDTITRLHKPLPYKGLVRFYKETLMSVVIETKDEIIEKTKGWSTPIYVNRGKALRWCDCRQDIKVIGIQE